MSGVYGFINALNVIETAKKEGNYTADSIYQPNNGPFIRNYEGATFYKPGQYNPLNPLQPIYTYTEQQVAHANFVANSVLRDLQAGKLIEHANKLDQAGAANVQRVDPLVFDLDGDGIETTTLQGSTSFFDLDNNGLAENTSWLSPDDGLLVLDRNNNGNRSIAPNAMRRSR